MKKILAVFGLAAALLLQLSPTVFAQDLNDFNIVSFDADYYLSKNDKDVGELRIEEKIVADFQNFGVNHGILRAIPKSYRGHGLKPEIISITDDKGDTYPYTTYTENDNLVLKIGDANSYVSGLTTYDINYRLSDVVTFYDSYDELFWDTNGTQWPQSFGYVEARFHIPFELKGRPLCYSGGEGSTQQNCQIEVFADGQGTVVTAHVDNLAGYENLSVVLGFDKGIFQADPWPRQWLIIQAFMVAVPPLVLAVVMFRRWQSRGRDPLHLSDSRPPQYAPPDMNILLSSVVLHEGFQAQVISAAIIEMAIAGYIRIYEVQKKKFFSKSDVYELELVRSATDLSDEQKQVVKAIFGSTRAKSTRIDLGSLANKLYSTAGELGKSLPKLMTREGYFMANPTKIRNRYTSGAVVLGFVSLALFMTGLFAMGAGLVLGALVVAAFIKAMPARSVKGVQLKNYLLGMEDYMKMAEEDRIKFLQSPSGVGEFSAADTDEKGIKLNLYEKLLPYAMLFGIEKEWAKQFSDLYEQPPQWLNSTHPLNAVYLSSALGNLSSVTSSAFSAPSSSSSSGFGGGGFSGGGGGGGGGGGW